MPKGLLDSARLVAKVNGEWHDVNPKPRHLRDMRRHFAGRDDVDEMEQSMFMCWMILHEEGVWPGDADSFDMALDDIGVPDGDDDPKSLTREIAALAVATGISPNELMDTEVDMLAAMVEVVNERSRRGN